MAVSINERNTQVKLQHEHQWIRKEPQIFPLLNKGLLKSKPQEHPGSQTDIGLPDQKVTSKKGKTQVSASLLAENLNYPTPIPPDTRKNDMFQKEDYVLIDAHASNTPETLLYNSVEDLVRYLCHPPLSELARLRAIYRWITSLRLEAFLDERFSNGEKASLRTPIYQLQKVSSQTSNYAAVFTCFARSAGLCCLTIRGISKSSGYAIGEPLDRQQMRAQWNAVYVNGNWRFIDAYWARVSSTENDEAISEKWVSVDLRLDDSEMTSGAYGKNNTLEKQHVQCVNDFFFIPDPDQFIVTHLPDDNQWQLLDKSSIWTEEKFQDASFIRETFFELEMKMLPCSKTNCVVKTVDGKAIFVFGIPTIRGKSYNFTYALFCNKHSIDRNSHSLILERYLLFSHRSDCVEFSVKLPVTGQFKLNLYAKEKMEHEFNLLCSYVIDCSETAKNIEPLPDCPDIGWGLSTELEMAGIVPISHVEPMFSVTNNEIEIPFKASSDQNVGLLYVHSNDVDEWHGSRHGILTRHKTSSLLSIKLRLPKPGLYAIKLFASKVHTEGDIPNVINYLVNFQASGSSAIGKPFPMTHEGILGAHYLSDALLINVSSSSGDHGIIKTSDGKVDFRMNHIDNQVELLVHLHSINFSESTLATCCNKEASANETTLSINLPRSGEYALNIYARRKQQKNCIYAVWTYLIRSNQTSLREMKEIQSNTNHMLNERRNLIVTFCTHAQQIIKYGLLISNVVMVYQTPVIFATAIKDSFRVEVPRGTNPTLAELQKERAITFFESHQVSKVVSKDKEIFTFLISQNGLYKIDFYEYPPNGVIIHIFTYSINRRKPTLEELNELGSTFDEWVETNTETEEEPVKHSAGKRDNELKTNELQKDTLLGKVPQEKYDDPNIDAETTKRKVQEVSMTQTSIKPITTPVGKSVLVDSKINTDLHSPSETSADAEQKLRNAVRAKLEEAVKGSDEADIQKVLEEIKTKTMKLDNDLLQQAATRLESIQMAEKLKNAVTARNLPILYQLMQEIEQRNLRSQIPEEVKAADDVISRLNTIKQLTQMIADMDRQLVAEVKSYLKPLPPVFNVISTTFMLFGEPKSNMKDWKSVQHLFIQSGSDSLKQRVNVFDIPNINIETAIDARNMISPYSRDEVAKISSGLAMFYDWNISVIEEVESLYMQSGKTLDQVPEYHDKQHKQAVSVQRPSTAFQQVTSPKRLPFQVASQKTDRHRPVSANISQQDYHKKPSKSSEFSHKILTTEPQEPKKVAEIVHEGLGGTSTSVKQESRHQWKPSSSLSSKSKTVGLKKGI